MVTNSPIYTISAYADNNITLKASQGEQGIKLANFALVNDGEPLDLTDATFILYSGIKSDLSPCWIECSIINASDGIIALNEYAGLTDVAGTVHGKIIVISANGNVQFDGINLNVSVNHAFHKLGDSNAFQALEAAVNKIAVITPEGTITIDDELNENSPNPVQNQVVTAIINTLADIKINKTDAIKFNHSGDFDSCNEPNYIYRVLSDNHWYTVLCQYDSANLAQYRFSANGGIEFRTATKSGNEWVDFTAWKSYAIAGTTLAEYGITDAYTKSESNSLYEPTRFKVDQMTDSARITTGDHLEFPTVAATKNFTFDNFYRKAEIDEQRPHIVNYTLLADYWENNTQAINIDDSDYTITEFTKPDIDFDGATSITLCNAGTIGIYIANDDGALTAYLIGKAPTTDINVQITLTETYEDESE